MVVHKMFFDMCFVTCGEEFTLLSSKTILDVSNEELRNGVNCSKIIFT